MGKRPVDSTPTVNERSARSGEPVVEPVVEPGVEPGAAVAAATDAGARYQLGDEIARGGMGRVVDATDTVLGRSVAFKEALSEDTEALRRFAREIRITARLEHPSIVPVHDAGTTPDGTPFYVMRKVSGRPLEDLVMEAETLSARLALVPHVLAAAQAIAHAHERGVMHRDLKPSNILVGSLGETVVIDWGLAKVIGEADEPSESAAAPITAGDSLRTRIGTVFGTPGFMSPEQLRGEAVDARSDVYALGATLYYVLARRPPHAAQSEDEMMSAALAGPPQPLAELAPGVPPELGTIAATALAHDDRRRYPTAAAFIADLQRFLTGQLVASHRYSRRARLARFLRRHKLPVAIGGLALVAIAVVATISIRRVLAERNRADAALAEALDRNEQLVVNQAVAILESNPTAAVATAKALGPARWREARAIGMAARANGVARGYPGAYRTVMLQLTEDGTHAMAGGDDGVVQLLDLVGHTSRELLRLPPETHMELLDHDRHLVAWSKDRLEIVEIASGARQEITPPGTRIWDVFAEGDRVWVTDQEYRIHTLRVGEPGLHRVPLDEAIRVVDMSPDGAWVAYGGSGLWLQHADGPVLPLATGAVTNLDWSDDNKHLAVSVDRQVLEITITNGIPAVTMKREDSLVLVLAAIGQAIFIALPTEVRKISATSPNGSTIHLPRSTGGGTVLAMVHGYRGSLVAQSGFGGINVYTEDVTVAIAAPTPELHRLAASPSSRFLVAATNGRILAWDLAPLLPDRLPLEEVVSYGVIGDHQVVAMYAEKPAEWYDLEKRDSRPVDLGSGLAPLNVISAPHEDLMIASMDAGAYIYRRGQDTPQPLERASKYAMFTEQDEILLTTSDGRLLLYTPPDYASRVLFQHAAEPLALSTQPAQSRWIAILYGDGTAWRYDRETNTSSSVPAATSATWVYVGQDGEMFLSDGPKLLRWTRDGRLGVIATLPRAITNAFVFDDNHALVLTDDRAGYDVVLEEGGRVTSRFPPASRIAPLAVSREIVIQLDLVGRLRPTDRVTGISWSVGHPSGAAFSGVSIARGGERIISMILNRLVAWRQVVPKTPEATRAFLDTLTNAQAPIGAAALTWD